MPIFTKPLMLENTSLIDSQDNSLSKGFSFNMVETEGKSQKELELSLIDACLKSFSA